MGSHNIKDDIYFTYGNAFGTRLKVIFITKNYQVHDKRDIRLITKDIHEIHLKNEMNPLESFLGEKKLSNFEDSISEVVHYLSCDAEYGDGSLSVDDTELSIEGGDEDEEGDGKTVDDSILVDN